MKKSEDIVRYSAKQLDRMLRQGKSRTDWQKVDAMPQAEVERLADAEEGPLPEGWESTVIIGLPPRKDHINIRLDHDVLEWFKATGSGYQTRINNVLRAFVDARRRAGTE